MDPKIDISIVIPAYNEEHRLGGFLEKLTVFCQKRRFTYEIIVVDDGSRDATSMIASGFQAGFPALQVIRIAKNRGKGFAVKTGLLKSSGDVRVFLDADGSVLPDEIEKNLFFLREGGYDIFLGSRVLRHEHQVLKVRWYRRCVGEVFNFFVRTFLFKEILDTQCGFKMFRKEVVEPLFSRVYLNGFGFDIEVLYLAHKMGFKMKEGAVSWRHAEGSKVNLAWDAAKMFWNILQVRNWHCTPINVKGKYLGPNEYQYMYDLETRHWWYVSRRHLMLALIQQWTKAPRKILDVGTGTGGNLEALGSLGQARGIDASDQAVEFCRRRGLVQVRQSRVEDIIADEGSFDVITCLDVLEHVDSPVQVLARLKMLLNPHGKMVITVPAFRLLWSQHDEALCHRRRYDKRMLAQEVTDAGLKIEKSGYFFFSSFFFVAPIRLFRRIFPPMQRIRSDTTTLPPRFLNEVLKFLFQMEAAVACRMGLPFGTTLYAVVSDEGLEGAPRGKPVEGG